MAHCRTFRFGIFTNLNFEKYQFLAVTLLAPVAYFLLLFCDNLQRVTELGGTDYLNGLADVIGLWLVRIRIILKLF